MKKPNVKLPTLAQLFCPGPGWELREGSGWLQ